MRITTDTDLPTVTDLQLEELRFIAKHKGRLDNISRVTVNVERKKLIEWKAPLLYIVTPLGFDVLAANRKRATKKKLQSLWRW